MTATTDLTITPKSPFRSDREADAVAFIIGGLAEMACPLAPRADGCQHPSGSCKPEGCSAC
ncbi:MAG: hypothetical protein WBA97_34450 [Actinophytocola sp.]|uniref:hypothetical protein n=1 Tax=Actinophytocola sp. TaxID=1872138 RepID=UPI003C77EEBC